MRTLIKERDVEVYLREKVKAAGGKAYKWVSPGNAGVPDRIVILPGGRIAFVELKSPGKTSTQLQRYRQGQLQKLGCQVYADIDSADKVDRLVKALMDPASGVSERISPERITP
jgi:hypothetical protein